MIKISNEPLAENMRLNGAQLFHVTKSKIHYRIPMTGLIRVLTNTNETKNLKCNQITFKEAVYRRENDSWTGGTMAQLETNLREGIDTSGHRTKLSELQRGDLHRKLTATFAAVKKQRRLKTSDSDGELVLARRYDDRPFTLSVKERRATKTIELYCNFSFSAVVKKESIDNFGVFAWALVNMIESSGVLVRVVVIQHALDTHRKGNCDLLVETVVKEPDQYISPSQIAAAFSTLYFRRALFGAIIISSDLVGEEVSSGLGRPKRDYKPVEFKDGRLILSGDSLEGCTDEVLTELRKALA